MRRLAAALPFTSFRLLLRLLLRRLRGFAAFALRRRRLPPAAGLAFVAPRSASTTWLAGVCNATAHLSEYVIGRICYPLLMAFAANFARICCFHASGSCGSCSAAVRWRSSRIPSRLLSRL